MKERVNVMGIRGYDPETGIPVREKLEKLGLKDIADKLGTSVANE
jgi:hypothetical protein